MYNLKEDKMFAKRGWYLKASCFLFICILWMVYYALLPGMKSVSVNNLESGCKDCGPEFSSGIFGGLRYTADGKIRDSSNFEFDGMAPKVEVKHKIIHLDLKGMPPLVSYYEQLFPMLKRIGATGILLEYEDMFPYHGKLKSIASREAYTKTDVDRINDLARANNLKVIPLVQTFGHLEFVLKLEEFAHLRESPREPQAICPSNNQSIQLLWEMIDQVMALHPGLKHFHIGADEVYQIGRCPLCNDKLAKSGWTNVELFLDHVSRVAKYVQDVHGVRPIMWDDEFRSADESLIWNSGVGHLVDIVVWNYRADVEIPSEIWKKYSRLFSSIWIGSAFKGANEPNSMVVNETLYLENHYSWLQIMRRESDITFSGIMLTGWQRYDHFAVPCETFPMAIPSLVSCMTLINATTTTSVAEIIANVSDVLECSMKLEYCRFPGSEIYNHIRRLFRLQKSLELFKKSNIFKGWMNPMNLKAGYSSPHYIHLIFSEIMSMRADVRRLESQLESALSSIFTKWSTQEWMGVFYKPLMEELDEMYHGINNVVDKSNFPRRPLRYGQRKFVSENQLGT